jgi:hypothetical protein
MLYADPLASLATTNKTKVTGTAESGDHYSMRTERRKTSFYYPLLKNIRSQSTLAWQTFNKTWKRLLTTKPMRCSRRIKLQEIYMNDIRDGITSRGAGRV